MKMRKVMAIILSLVLAVSCIIVPANAESRSGIIPPINDSSDLGVYCPYCGGTGTYKDSWPEYNYYYVRIWYQFQCNDCDKFWNTAQDISNITGITAEVNSQ